MQLPQPSNPPPVASVPLNYNSYFSSTPHSRPIQITNPSTRFSNNFTERVMGLDFEQPSTNMFTSNFDSDFYMDQMDDENPSASFSNTRSETVENVFGRTALSGEDDKENGSKSKTQASTSAANMSNYISPVPKSHSNFNEEELLINEETDSEAGYSGEDDCMSNCGCVHSTIGSPIHLSDNNNCYESSAPFTRLGFRSIGDIIGYTHVVRAQRLEALAELRNAVDKFNDMRQQRTQNLRSKLNTTN